MDVDHYLKNMDKVHYMVGVNDLFNARTLVASLKQDFDSTFSVYRLSVSFSAASSALLCLSRCLCLASDEKTRITLTELLCAVVLSKCLLEDFKKHINFVRK